MVADAAEGSSRVVADGLGVVDGVACEACGVAEGHVGAELFAAGEGGRVGGVVELGAGGVEVGGTMAASGRCAMAAASVAASLVRSVRVKNTTRWARVAVRLAMSPAWCNASRVRSNEINATARSPLVASMDARSRLNAASKTLFSWSLVSCTAVRCDYRR